MKGKDGLLRQRGVYSDGSGPLAPHGRKGRRAYSKSGSPSKINFTGELIALTQEEVYLQRCPGVLSWGGILQGGKGNEEGQALSFG